MLKKHKYYSTLLIVVFLSFLSIGFCFARELEVKLPGLGEEPDLPEYISIIFKLVMGIAGTIAVLALVIGAVQYMASAGNPETISNAKKRIFGAIFGIILLLSSYLILRTINPQLIELELTPLSELPGLYLITEGEKNPCPTLMADTTKLASGTTILYDCLDPKKNPTLLVFFYPEKNHGGEPNVKEISCGDSQSLDGQSFEIRTKLPGVYLYSDSGCSPGKYRSNTYMSSQEDLGGFNKNVRCVEIINDPDNDVYYDVVLHEEKDNKGKCLDTIIHSKGEEDSPEFTEPEITPIYSSATIVRWNPDWGSAGDGVIFLSEAFGKGGKKEVTDAEMYPIYKGALEDLVFDYTGTGIKKEEQEIKPDFEKSPGSIRITGGYLVVLYAEKGIDIYCQAFDENITNLKTEWITKEGKKLYKVEIIPTK